MKFTENKKKSIQVFQYHLLNFICQNVSEPHAKYWIVCSKYVRSYFLGGWVKQTVYIHQQCLKSIHIKCALQMSQLTCGCRPVLIMRLAVVRNDVQLARRRALKSQRDNESFKDLTRDTHLMQQFIYYYK